MSDVARSDSQKSDRNRTVSFNRDVHVKRIVPANNKHKSVSRASSSAGSGSYGTLPIHRDKFKRYPKEEVDQEGSRKVVDHFKFRGNFEDQKYNTLPTRLKNHSDKPLLAPKKPLRLHTDNSNSKSKLYRSKSDPLQDTPPLAEFNEDGGEQKVPLTPIEEEASKNPKSGSVTDYLKEIINEIDNKSFDNETNMLRPNTEKMLSKQTGPKPVIYAQVVCSKNKPFMKKETVHMTIPKTIIHSSDSDEGLGGCKDPVKKAYIRFGDEIDQSNSNKEELIKPKVRNYESKIFFDFESDYDRCQGDGRDSKWDVIVDSDGNQLLTVQNLRKRNELSERRNMLEDRINSRWNQRYGSKEDHGYVEKYVREMKIDKNGHSKPLAPLKEDTVPQLSRYKSNPELVRSRSPTNIRNRYYNNKREEYEYYDDDYIEPDYDYYDNDSPPHQQGREVQELVREKLSNSGTDRDYKRHRSTDRMKIVQTKSLQNLSRKKKGSDDSEDEGFASSILIANDNRTSNSPSKGYILEPPKVKKSGFQKVKQLFLRDGKKKKCQQENGKFVQYDRGEVQSDAMGHSYGSRGRLSTPASHSNGHSHDYGGHTSDHGHSSSSRRAIKPSNNNGWFKSLDRLALRGHRYEREEKDNITNQLAPAKKSLRFFGDTDIESGSHNNNQKQKTGRYRSNTNSTSSSLSVHRFQPSDRYKSQSFTNLKDSDEDRMRLYHNRTMNSKHLKNKSLQNLADTKSRQYDGNSKVRGRGTGGGSSTEDGDGTGHRGVVYLHAAKGGEISNPSDPQHLKRHSYSREELSSNHPQTVQFQPRIKSVSRSFSLLAPWRPKHREESAINYVQPLPARYVKKSSRSSDSSDYNAPAPTNAKHTPATTLYKKKERHHGDMGPVHRYGKFGAQSQPTQ